MSRATQPHTDLLVEEIQEAIATGRVRPQNPEYAAWLITQLSMSVFHYYDCAGLEEPVDAIADRLWTFCYDAGSTAWRVNLMGPSAWGLREISAVDRQRSVAEGWWSEHSLGQRIAGGLAANSACPSLFTPSLAPGVEPSATCSTWLAVPHRA